MAAANLAPLGMPAARRAALVALAEAVMADHRLFGPFGTVEEAIARLRAIRGVGEWTAQYIALRALRETDAFPASDVGLLRGATRGAAARTTPADLLRRAEPWRPWRAYAAQHLWAADAGGGGGHGRCAWLRRCVLRIDRMDTPIGELSVVADERGPAARRRLDGSRAAPAAAPAAALRRAGFALEPESGPRWRSPPRWRPTSRATSRPIQSLPVATGGTAFQRAVWAALRDDPVRHHRILRGAGAAHRPALGGPRRRPRERREPDRHRACPAIAWSAAGGALTGYGGGLDRKRWLLAHEARGRGAMTAARPEAAQVCSDGCTDGLLVLANAWDAGSARLMQSLGAKAVATTSAGVAWSHGFADGDCLPVPLLAVTVADMARVLTVPLSVDVEGGYSTDPSVVGRYGGSRRRRGRGRHQHRGRLRPPDLLCAKIEQARRAGARLGVDLFVNARTDVYLCGLVPGERRVEETLARAERYRGAGADGLFVPGVTDASEIRTIATSARLPLNVLARPGLPGASELEALGVRRLSAGSNIAEAVFANAAVRAAAFLRAGTSEPLAEGALRYADINALMPPP